MRKYDFKYNIVNADFNILGGSNDSDGSLMELMTKKVTELEIKIEF